MSDWPLVSVIIPVYEDAHLVDRAVESVLDQTYPDVEICLIDSSGEASVEALAETHEAVRYQFTPPDGPAAARNVGLELATGELIAFLDADDYWRETKLARQVPVITDGGADLVYSDQEVVDL